jgi:hypothetical protein
MTLPLKDLKAECLKTPGLWDDLISKGQIDLLTMTLDISKEAFDGVNRKHFGAVAIGTVVKEVIRPAVKIIDRLTGTNLSECAGCAMRELKLNSL